jgi:hypothetical protein
MFKNIRISVVLFVSSVASSCNLHGAADGRDDMQSRLPSLTSNTSSSRSSSNVSKDILAQGKPLTMQSPIPDAGKGTSLLVPRDRGANPIQRIFFRYNGVDNNYGKLAFLDYSRPEPIHFIDGLICEAAYVAGGRGICVGAKYRILGIFAATLFDAKTFQILGKVPVQGVPSRARVSPLGTLAVSTTFTSGHGYASVNFSTQTLLIDVANARILANLEEFSVTLDGKPLRNKDFNFWGVTFTPDSRQFYSTLSTQGRHLLVRGDVASRSAVVLYENVECPSLSPDGKRIAFKKRLTRGSTVTWQIHTFDLATGVETALPEKRSVDDQLEWLDNANVLYTLPETDTQATPTTNIWRMPIDGSAPPDLFLEKASSPAVVR